MYGDLLPKAQAAENAKPPLASEEVAAAATERHVWSIHCPEEPRATETV